MSVSDDFLVTVMSGSTPPVTVDPPMAVGTIPNQRVEKDGTVTIDVSGYFSPTTGLTYTAESDSDNATAVDGSNVTITGVAEGMTKVTVTATDSDERTAIQEISVTVTPMMADYKPSTVTIEAKGGTKDLGIDPGQTLLSLDDAIVSVHRKAGNVWTLTGTGKGDTTVRILRENQTVEKSIPVEVKNSPPELIDPPPSRRIEGPTRLVDDNGIEITGTVPLNKVAYHFVPVTYSAYFEDKDGIGDIKKYVATSAVKTDVKVISVINNGINDGIVVNVIQKVGVSFALMVHAVDIDDGESGTATITVGAVSPHPIRYGVGQEKGDGILDPVTVKKRYGVTHTIQFKPYGTGPSGFNFVESFQTKTDGRRLINTHDESFAAIIGKPESLPAPAEGGVPYYTVTGTGSVELVDPKLSFDSDNNPMLTYKLKAGSAGSVIIVYSAITCVAETPTECASEADYKRESVTKTLRVTIE